MNLWNASKRYLKQVTTKCAKSGNSTRVIVGQNFDLTCKGGAVTKIGIKKKGHSSIQELNLVIEGLPGLKEIILDGSNISGDLRDLQAPPDLQRLHLRWCRVSANLQDLQKYSLEALKLSGDISGSLNDLNWSRLKFLDLREAPGVTGDVPTDRGDSPLEGLWLLGTNASGDLIELLNNHPKVEYLHLEGEGFHGTVADQWRNGVGPGAKLKELVLRNTKVEFNMSKRKPKTRETVERPEPPFPKLAKLDVSGTELSMDVWDFLDPLADNYYLSEVRARGCGLSGQVPGIFSADNFPLYWQVNILDLSHNLIDGLEGKPRPAMYLDVSNNPQLASVAEAYFQERGPMVLDLQKTDFRMAKEARLRNLNELERFPHPCGLPQPTRSSAGRG